MRSAGVKDPVRDDYAIISKRAIFSEPWLLGTQWKPRKPLCEDVFSETKRKTHGMVLFVLQQDKVVEGANIVILIGEMMQGWMIAMWPMNRVKGSYYPGIWDLALASCTGGSPGFHQKNFVSKKFLWLQSGFDPREFNMEPEHDTWKKLQCQHFNRNILRTNPIPRQNLQLILTDRGGGNTEKESAAHEHDMVYVDVLDLGTSFGSRGSREPPGNKRVEPRVGGFLLLFDFLCRFTMTSRVGVFKKHTFEMYSLLLWSSHLIQVANDSVLTISRSIGVELQEITLWHFRI